MAQISNDCKGIQYVSSDAGQILFSRPQLAASGKLASGNVVINMPGWTSADGVASLVLASVVTANTGGLASSSPFA